MPTIISDVIIPEIFNPYVIARTAALSAIRTSGIAANVPGVSVPVGGKTINMPFWNDLDAGGDIEVLSDTTGLTPAKIDAGKDIAVILARGKAWGVNDLAGLFAGSDPMRAIGDLVAAYWARQEQKVLLKTLEGVFGAASMAGNALDISSEAGNAAFISNNTLIDAIALLGDSGHSLSGILCHSAVMYDLAKKKLLDQQSGIPGESAPEFASFLGRRVIVDDSCPVDSGVYTTYLFGPGAIGYAEGSGLTATETQRDILKGEDLLANRRNFIFHPRGVKWIGNSAGSTPDNTELADAGSWERVYENKNVRMVEFKHKIGPLA